MREGVGDFAREREMRERLRRAWGGEESEQGASGDEREEKREVWEFP